MPGPNDALTDQQLQELMGDNRFGEADMALLTPGERTRLAAIKARSSTTGRIKDIAIGAAKGVGNRAVDLGSLVHNTPVVGSITDKLATMIGGPGTDPDMAFTKANQELEATSPAQSVGKGLEEMGEFFIPGEAASNAISRGISTLLRRPMPNVVRSVSSPKLVNRAIGVASRVLGEGASAGAVSALHGDEHPEYAASAGALGPVVGEGLAAGARAMGTPLGRRIAPVLLGGTAVSAFPNPMGLGATLGMYGLSKGAVSDYLAGPGHIRSLEQLSRAGAKAGGRVGAGTIDQLRLQRRRLEAK